MTAIKLVPEDRLVYFIGSSEAGRIKIGSAQIPEQRLKGLATGNPYDIKVICTLVGGESKERELHKKFKMYHMQKEWYKWSESIQLYIDGVLDGQGGEILKAAPKIQPQKPLGTAKKDKYPTIDLPHGNNLKKVVGIVRTVSRREVSPFGERHAEYYAHAARILGFLRRGEKSWAVTTVGQRLLTLQEGSLEEYDLIVGRMKFHALLQWACLEERRTPEEMVARILRSYDVTASTAKRRAACLKTWWKYTNNPPKELT